MVSLLQSLSCPSLSEHQDTKTYDLEVMTAVYADFKIRKDPPLKQRTFFNRTRVPFQPEELELEYSFDQLEFRTIDTVVEAFQDGHGPAHRSLEKSNFCNSTDMEKTYLFRVNRESTCHCITQIQQGVSMGEDCLLDFAVPEEICQETSEFGGIIEVRKIHGKKIRRSLQWFVEHQVNVQPKSTTVAEAIVMEKNINVKYSARTLVTGNIRIVARNPEKEGEIVREYVKDVARIVKFYQETSLGVGNCEDTGCTWDLNNKTVGFDTKWCCFFHYGYKENVKYNNIWNYDDSLQCF